MDIIPVTETSSHWGRPQFSYRGVFDPLDFGFNDNDALNSSWRAAVSYVTGAHNMKVGYSGTFIEVHNGRVPNHTQLRYTFNGNAPASAACPAGGLPRLCPTNVSYFLSPRWDQHDRTQTLGLYAQDQWTMGRLTLQGGIRYDRAWSWAPAEGNGTTETSRFNPQPISFERTVSVRGFNDITPRFGVAYDLFGNGKTALKVNGGKYLEAATGDVIYSSNNPAARIITRIGSGPARGARLDRRQPQLCRGLQPAESGAAGQPGRRRRPVRGGRRRRLELRQRQPEFHDHQSRDPRRVGRASVRLADRRVRAARAHSAAVDRGGLQPPVVGQLLRHRQHADDGGRLRHLLAADSAARESAGRRVRCASFVAITPAASARGAQSYMTSEKDYGDARTAYWHGVDFTATARLTFGLNLQGGTSTGRGVRDTCTVTSALPELLGTARVDSCDVTENWATSFRGLASYTIPKIDVLVSASMRSLVTPPGGSASNGLSLAANYVVPNLVIAQSLGRLPANALATGTTTVNLLNPGELYNLERTNITDMRFAKVFRFGGRRADVGIDLYNLFNSNVTTAYQQTYEYATNGAAWLRPTAIVSPRLARFHVTFDF